MDELFDQLVDRARAAVQDAQADAVGQGRARLSYEAMEALVVDAVQRGMDDDAKKRVELGRALAMEPKVLLMDEPFGALDALTRAHMQDSLIEIQARLNNTVIMITHDVDEAVLLSDRIVMMTNGPAATIGDIVDVELERPRNRVELADNEHYNHYRAAVLKFLYERQSKPEEKVA